MSVCQLISGYGTGTCCEWGMEKDKAGSPTKITFLTLSWQNRHGVAFPFPTSGVPKTSVSRKYPFLISFLTCLDFNNLPGEDKFWAAATRMRDNLSYRFLVDFLLGDVARNRIYYSRTLFRLRQEARKFMHWRRSWADTVLKTCLQSILVKVIDKRWRNKHLWSFFNSFRRT